jgi:poly(A) polymerase
VSTIESAVDLRAPRDGSEQALAELLQVPAPATELGRRFGERGFELALVGGSVRDLILGRSATSPDLDFATNARPEQVQDIVRGWAHDQWDVGIAFGTVGLARDGVRFEVTTYRAEAYDRTSRNPEVQYGDSLADDLARRDFTVNAMAITLASADQLLFVDPHQGVRDLSAGVLRTPGLPADSFNDDPLRMLRAARFVATLGLLPAPEVVAAMEALAPRLEIVAPERIRDELVKLVLGADPVMGLELLVDTGLAEFVLPELPAMKLSIDEHHQHKDVYVHSLTVLQQAVELEQRLPGGGPDLVVRLAALLHDIGKPATKKAMAGGKVSFHKHELVGTRMARLRLRALRFPKDVIAPVCDLISLHLRFHGYGEAAWTDSAVRRYVTDAGDQLDRLHVLTRSDCTTRNQKKAARLAAAYDALEDRIRRLAQEEDLRAIRPDLDGNAIMRILGVGPGPAIGRAYAHLLDVRLDQGPLAPAAAEAELRRWAAAEGDLEAGPVGS